MAEKAGLMVLAAGMGSRYGGLKQMDGMGPGGEVVLDYSVFDALRAGFGRVVFVIRRDLEEAFRERIGKNWEGRAEVEYAFQELDDLPAGMVPGPGRAKPWGTAHAIWAGRKAMAGRPFAAINADDFYGADSFRVLARHFLAGPKAGEHAMAAFKLGQTLSDNGTVSRGVCLRGPDGRLSGIRERFKVSRAADGRVADASDPEPLTGDEPVSMNCWGFMPDFFDELGAGLEEFARKGGTDDPKAEFTIPGVVDAMIRGGRGSVAVLETASRWFGVTYRDDKAGVQAAIRGLVESGEYPAALFG